MDKPLINGQAYSWSQVRFNIMGVQVAGVTAINYEDSQEMQDNYGVGSYPSSRGYGKYEAKANITLHMVEVERLQAAVPDGRLQSIPEFDIVISFLPKNGIIVNHTIKNCRFKQNKRDMKAGDMEIPVPLDLQPSHIIWK